MGGHYGLHHQKLGVFSTTSIFSCFINALQKIAWALVTFLPSSTFLEPLVHTWHVWFYCWFHCNILMRIKYIFCMGSVEGILLWQCLICQDCQNWKLYHINVFSVTRQKYMYIVYDLTCNLFYFCSPWRIYRKDCQGNMTMKISNQCTHSPTLQSKVGTIPVQYSYKNKVCIQGRLSVSLSELSTCV